jgi:nicotinamide riboside transporter PnuC
MIEPLIMLGLLMCLIAGALSLIAFLIRHMIGILFGLFMVFLYVSILWAPPM